MRKSAVVFLGDDVQSKEHIFKVFERSDINVENSSVSNWDALEEIVRDALKVHGLDIVVRGVNRAAIDEDALSMLMSILEDDHTLLSGSIKVEDF